MIQERSFVNGLTLVLLLLSLGLGGMLYWQWLSPPSVTAGGSAGEGGSVPPDGGSGKGSPVPPFTPAPLSAFREIQERPLFIEGRLPPEPPPEEPKAKQASTPLKLTLEGVVITPESRVAVIGDLQSRETLRLAEGMSHNDWRVERVEHDRVTLLRGGEEILLKLVPDEESDSKPPKLPFRLPLRRPPAIVPGQ
jgi:hypothetical protein